MQPLLGAPTHLWVAYQRLVPESSRVFPFFAQDIIEAEALAKFNPDPAIRFSFAGAYDDMVKAVTYLKDWME